MPLARSQTQPQPSRPTMAACDHLMDPITWWCNCSPTYILLDPLSPYPPPLPPIRCPSPSPSHFPPDTLKANSYSSWNAISQQIPKAAGVPAPLMTPSWVITTAHTSFLARFSPLLMQDSWSNSKPLVWKTDPC